MKRILAVALAVLTLSPSFAFAQDDDDARLESDAPKRVEKAAKKGRTHTTATGENSSDDSTDATAPSTDDDGHVTASFPRYRYAYAASGVFLIGGIGLSYWAQGQAARAGTIASARDARSQLVDARTSAASANLMFALAGVSLGYALALEILPKDVADKADLTFHF